jgi:hypothetical protein
VDKKNVDKKNVDKKNVDKKISGKIEVIIMNRCIDSKKFGNVIRRAVSRHLVLLSVITAGYMLLCSTIVDAQFFYNETCRNATGVFQVSGDAPGYTAGPALNIDQQGYGWLRLTDDLQDQLGYVLLDKTFPSTMGVTVEFDFKVWSPTPNHEISDGFSVFLYDADPLQNFQIGCYGGCLGYRFLQPAYLGIGIDEHGNFSTFMTNGQFTPQSIAIGNSFYEYVAGTGQQMDIGQDVSYTTPSSVRPNDAIYYRRVRIEIEPDQTAGMNVTVYLRTEISPVFMKIIGPVNVPQPPPTVLGLGFAGSTGGGYGYHEVRDVIIRTPGDLSVYKTAECANSKDNVVINTHIVHGFADATNNIFVQDTLPHRYTPAGAPYVSVAGNANITNSYTNTLGDGRLLYSYYINAVGSAEVKISYTGSFAVMPPQGEYRSGAVVVPPSGFQDDYVNDNLFSLTAYVEKLETATPTTQFITLGSPLTFAVSATHANDITYKWKVSPDNSNWTDINSSNTAVYTTAPFTDESTAYYRCVARWGSECSDSITFLCIPPLDNISDADCFVAPTVSAWGMDSIYSNEHNLSPYQNAIVGDIDNDGVVEIIVAMDPEETAATTQDRPASKIAIYKGNNIQQPPLVFETDTTFSWDRRVKYGIVKTKIADKDTCLIVVTEKDRFLRAYNYRGEKVWTSSVVYNTGTSVSYANSQPPGFTDFNHDGIPEVALSGKLFNSVNGDLLCEISSAPFAVESATVIAADVFNTGEQKYIAGNSIYDVNTDPSNVITGLTLNRTVTIPTDFTGDPDDPGSALAAMNGGVILPVDVDNDGQLDLVGSYRVGSPNNFTVLYIADPVTGTVKARKYIPDAGSSSYPFAGDIDGDGMVEIVIIKAGTADSLYAFKYVPGNPVLRKFWSLKHNDGSGATGITLFDFDRDGMAELVYRDERYLRIIDGSANSPYPNRNKAVSLNRSGTSAEYPVVADVDGDGQAEIIIVGGLEALDGTPYYEGRLCVYKSFDPVNAPWAPARKVWNQYAYNSVNINEDLTVPRYPLNPATVFPGIDGVLGTSDDLRPYNNFLQQATALSKNGTPLWLAPNGKTVGEPTCDYSAATDVLTVRIRVRNDGDAAFQAPFKITVYEHSTGNAKKYIYSWMHAIVAGETVDIVFDIPDFKQSGWTTPLAIQINDSGDGNSHQPVCDDAGRELLTGAVIAVDDRITAVKNSSDNKIAVTLNDLKFCAAPTVEIIAGGSPEHGILNPLAAGDTVIVYLPYAGYVGRDTITYSIRCSNNPADIDTARVYINVIELPDNVSDADCFTLPPPSMWGIEEAEVNPQLIFNGQTPMVGDIDNDGIIEIIITNISGGTGLYVYKGNDLTAAPAFITLPRPVPSKGSYAGLVRTKISATQDTTLIVTFNSNRTLSAYNCEGTELWTTAGTVSAGLATFGFADFNGDGYVEIYTGNTVIDAATGTVLCSGGANNAGRGACFDGTNSLQSSAAGDVMNNGQLQLAAGNQVYEVNIVDRTVPASNSMKVVKTLSTSVAPAAADGPSFLLDLNLDGRLDVLVMDMEHTTDADMYFYVWTPSIGVNGTVLVQNTVQKVAESGLPFIGDIDGDGYPEILVLTGSSTVTNQLNADDYIHAFKYVPGSADMNRIWTLPHTDGSGHTGMTLFDFNQDGIAEIVYRDHDHLRIINGSKKSHLTGNDTVLVYDLFSAVCTAATWSETPVVADIDNDGHAEIITAGLNIAQAQGNGNPYVSTSPLRVFKGPASAPWAPARKVWNQYCYNPVYINEDLTVPKVPLSPATVFSGEDGMQGTSDDLRPYNNFLQQATALSKNGTPLWLAPDAEPVGTPVFVYHADGDSLTVSLQITNTGDAALQAPLYVSAYKDAVTAANGMATDSSTVAVNAGETRTVAVTIRSLSAYLPFTRIIVSINDKGGATYVQSECNYALNDLPHPLADIPMARNDTVVTDINTPITFDVRNNDLSAACSKGALNGFDTIANSGLNGGTLTVNADSSFRYTPNTDFPVTDSLSYFIKCGADSSTAKVYIVLNKPLAMKYAACENAFVTLGFYANAGATHNWYADNGGVAGVLRKAASDTIIEQKSADAQQTFWVTTVFGGVEFAAVPVHLTLSDNCGNTLPSGCAATGTVIWKEDFGGNNTGDPKRAPDPLWTGVKTTYDYAYRMDLWLPAANQYALLKNIDTIAPNGLPYNPKHTHFDLDDHTSFGDTAKGYFLTFDANNAPGQFYEFEIDDLCPGSNLTFSAWLMNINPSDYTGLTSPNYRYPDVAFIIEDLSGNVLSAFYTGNIPITVDPTWLNYAFDFTVPASTDNVRVRVMNNNLQEGSTTGNDVAIDDIEVRFCTLPVSIPGLKADTTICKNTAFTFAGSYTDGGTFGRDLVCRWEYNATDDVNNSDAWTPTGNPGSGTGSVSLEHVIASADLSDAGYYRLVVANEASIGKYNCRAMSDIIRLRVIPGVTPGAVGADQTICHGTAPNMLKVAAPSGGTSAYVYQWLQSDDNGASWQNASNGTGSDTLQYSPQPLTATTLYQLKITGGSADCETVLSDIITVNVLPQAIQNYPDLRLRVCPSATPGAEINLSKYIDTVEVTNVEWSGNSGMPAINTSTGIIAANALVAGRTYTYTYTATNPCISDYRRKIYLKTLNGDSPRLPKDTIYICYETAEAIQINQIFGIDADGSWLYVPDGGDISPYIMESATFGGAQTMNGKGIYDDNTVPTFAWNGTTAKKIAVTYTPSNTSCLNGKMYRIIIVIYE